MLFHEFHAALRCWYCMFGLADASKESLDLSKFLDGVVCIQEYHLSLISVSCDTEFNPLHVARFIHSSSSEALA